MTDININYRQFRSSPGIIHNKIYLLLKALIKRLFIFLHKKYNSGYLNYPKINEQKGPFTIKKILWFCAPDDPQLKKFTVKHYILAENFYQGYLNGSTKDLNKLIACLYCDNKGFDETRVNKHARLINMTSRVTREIIGRDYSLFRGWLTNSYPDAFWYLEMIRKMMRYKFLIEVFESISENAEIVHLIKLLELYNSYGRMYFNDTSRPIVYTWMFLDPHQVKFPDIKLFSQDSVMFSDGKILNPNHN